MHVEPEPFQVDEVDVIVADKDDTSRAFAAGALTCFGFVPERVRAVQVAADVVRCILEVQCSDRPAVGFAHQPGLPILVIADHQLIDDIDFGALREGLAGLPAPLRREPFLVCTSSRPEVVGNGESKCHCFVSNVFTACKLQYCLRLCQAWWKDRCGCADAVTPPRPVSDVTVAAAATAIDAAPGSPQLPGVLPWLPPEVPGDNTRGEQVGHHAALVATAVRMPSVQHTPPFTSARGVGKNATNLAPQPCLFEDIEMTCIVGRGAFGRVYKANWHLTTVALKVVECFNQQLPDEMSFEGELASSLAHPHLVQTYMYSVRDMAGTGCTLKGYELWIVQEWCGLGTLWQKISTNQGLPRGGFAEVTDVSIEIASGANYLHCRGIIHGDLTANNVLLVERTCPKGYICKVGDFGLARVLDKGRSAINTATMGTIAYMPPELFQRSGGSLSKKVDVYSFGILLWQLCTGSFPFEGLAPTQVVVMVSQGALLDMPGNVPNRLLRLYKQTLARQPGDRPRFSKVIQDLLKIVRAEEEFQRVCVGPHDTASQNLPPIAIPQF